MGILLVLKCRCDILQLAQLCMSLPILKDSNDVSNFCEEFEIAILILSHHLNVYDNLHFPKLHI